MEQAGINSFRLIEARNLYVLYNEDGSIVQVATDGTEINIYSCYKHSLVINEKRGANGKITYNYELNFIELDPVIINKLRRSIYGFIISLNMNDDTSKIILTPLLFDGANQNNNVSASYSTKLRNFEMTNNKIMALNPNSINWILETGYWNSDNYWLNSANWIN